MSEEPKVLLVDDRLENLLALESVLEGPELQIFQATSGNEALGLMLEHDFALVLLDVQMPDMDGFETAELMRGNKRTADIPIIFVTAISKERGYVFKGYESGAFDYIFKPIDPDIIRCKVKVFLDLYRHRRQLEKSEARYRTLVESAPIGILALNGEGIIQSFNRSAERIFGYRASDIIGQPIAQIIDPEYNPEHYPYLMRYLHDGDTRVLGFAHEVVGKRADGHTIAAKMDLNQLHLDDQPSFITVIEDISGRKEVEDELRLNKEILDHLAEGVLLIRTSDERIVYTNPRFDHLFGYSSHELIGQHISIVNAETDLRPEETARRITAILKEKGTWSGEVYNRRKDGSCFWCRASTTTFQHGAYGSVWVSVHEDITDFKNKEEELRTARDMAEIATKAKSRFLATMSHEIRTPMNGVIGMTNLLMDTDLTQEQREYVEVARSSGEVLLDIISDILDFSKIEAGRLEMENIEFDLRTTIESVGDILGAKAREKRLDLLLLVHHDVPYRVKGDPGRLRQVLINLITNAIKFTEKGEVALTCHLASEEGQHQVVHFQVKDTGIGIHTEKQKEMFMPFAQLDTSTTRKFGGTGLGLAISKQLVEAMGGSIRVESEAGQGAAFIFTITFEKPENEEPTDSSTIDLTGSKILILDPHEAHRTTLAGMLNTWGCNVHQAETEMGAMQQLDEAIEAGQPYHHALLVHTEGVMNASIMVERIRKEPRFESLALILATNMPSRGDAAKMNKLGVTAYLAKPIKHQLLGETLQAIQKQKYKQPQENALITRHSLDERNKKFRILLVEDNVVNQKVAIRMLEKGGYSCDLAENGEAALAAWRKHDYDLILMDCQMPVMDGYEATRIIREKEKESGRHNIIIALTAGALKGDRERCMAAGMDDYLSKPFKNNVFYNLLDKYLGKKT